MLFELLTGHRPFETDSAGEMLDFIRSRDPRPPRQFDDTIPRELDRICLKALAPRALDRYSTALDFCEDLQSWLAGRELTPTLVATAPNVADAAAPASATSDANRHPVRIVPKGLRVL